MKPEELLKAMEWRYATKKFDVSRPIPEETWAVLKKALVLSPSSLGLQLWRFYDVVSPGLRAQLREVSWGQAQVTDAAHYIVFTARRNFTDADMEKHLIHLCELRGIPRSDMDGYAQKIKGMLSARTQEQIEGWMGHQVYIALGVLMTAAAVLGVDACPLEGFDPVAYDRILGLESSPYRAMCALALGYRSDDSYALAAKARFDEGDVIVSL